MLRNHHQDNTQCLLTPGQRNDNVCESQRVQARYNDEGVFDDTLFLTRSNSKHTSDKVSTSEKVIDPKGRRITVGHNLSEFVKADKNRHAGVSGFIERNESLSTQQSVQVRQNGSMSDSFPSPTEQSVPASIKAQLFPESCSDFLDMTRPKKNGNTRVSTECHILRFKSCFERMQNSVDSDTDDLSDDEEEKEYDDNSFILRHLNQLNCM
eukprot:CAMPEP_0185724214 /NCGR_PEP_ID=MMETSP1171-20130828/764_1 /TAXON_ID=374046 /ORGANISM="Helicotheca tamensis, Strain CCMP826" /LENGTH=209 /DNA_ID=CAMNT_0028392017 /DNA_START=72 /DNA_END=701 /DNA_ORIENTATION=+